MARRWQEKEAREILSRFGNRLSTRFVALAALLAIFIVPAASHSQSSNWSFALLNPDQQGLPGTTLVYTGQINNFTGGDLILGGDSLSFNGIPSDAFSFDFAPEYLALGGVVPSSGYDGPILFVTLSPGAPAGATVSGSVTLFADAPGDPPDATDGFAATVVTAGSAPSPGTLPLLVVAIFSVSATPKIRFWRKVRDASRRRVAPPWTEYDAGVPCRP